MSGLDLPTIQDLLNGNIVDIIKNIFTTIFTIIVAVIDYIFKFVETLMEINLYILNMINSVESENVGELPFLEVIGAYRFLVGDTIFYLTYMMIISGAFFTLYKLLLVLYRRYIDAKKNTTSSSNSLKGIFSTITDFFKH